MEETVGACEEEDDLSMSGLLLYWDFYFLYIYSRFLIIASIIEQEIQQRRKGSLLPYILECQAAKDKRDLQQSTSSTSTNIINNSAGCYSFYKRIYYYN